MINLNPQTKKGQTVQSFLADNPDTKFYALGWGNKEFQYAINGTFEEMTQFVKEKATDWAVICFCDHDSEQMLWMNHRPEWRKEQGLKPLAAPSRRACDMVYQFSDQEPLANLLAMLFRKQDEAKEKEFENWMKETYWYCSMVSGKKTEN